jgi:hypothetical protein
VYFDDVAAGTLVQRHFDTEVAESVNVKIAERLSHSENA